MNHLERQQSVRHRRSLGASGAAVACCPIAAAIREATHRISGPVGSSQVHCRPDIMVRSPRNRFRRTAFTTTGCCAGRRSLEETMEKKIAGLLGALAALGTLSAPQATPAPHPTEVVR